MKFLIQSKDLISLLSEALTNELKKVLVEINSKPGWYYVYISDEEFQRFEYENGIFFFLDEYLENIPTFLYGDHKIYKEGKTLNEYLYDLHVLQNVTFNYSE